MYYKHFLAKKIMVSVVMLTYRRADVLAKAIDSILAQTFSDFEFIILNDGSTDKTKEIVASYSDSRIRYYENQTNKGIAFSRNRAADFARGKYIMIMDDDDRSMPDRMEKQVQFLEQHPETDVVIGQIVGWPLVSEEHDEIAAGLIQYNNVGNANIMYRKSFAEKHKIKYNEDITYGEDWHFWLQMLFAGARFNSIKDNVIERGVTLHRYYAQDFDKLNKQMQNFIGTFFSPERPDDFYKADACGKLNMIEPKKIFSPEFIRRMKEINCPALHTASH